MLAVIAAVLACVTGETTCLRCLEDSDCFFCRDDNLCKISGDTNCTNAGKETTISTQCVEDLGGDAKTSVRYAIGFSILGISLCIDLLVRFLAHRGAKEQYAHL
jgi:hypothetical protein